MLAGEPVLTVEEVVTASSFRRRKRGWLMFLSVCAIGFGILSGALRDDWEKPLLFLDAIVFVIAIVQWAYLDAAELGFHLWRYFVPLMIICPGPFLVMPVYFVKSRGWIRGLAACGLAVAFLLLQFGLDFASSYLAGELIWGD